MNDCGAVCYVCNSVGKSIVVIKRESQVQVLPDIFKLNEYKGLINIDIDEVLEFIKRRFSSDCNWITGNCFYFATILLSRFPNGSIYYDVIDGHFLFMYNGKYYDWTGIVEPEGYLVEWEKFDEYDELQKKVIIRDCIN